MTIFINGSIAACLLGIAYLLMERLIDKLQAQPIRVVLVSPVVVEGDGELMRQAVSNIGYQVFRGTSLIAKVMR